MWWKKTLPTTAHKWVLQDRERIPGITSLEITVWPDARPSTVYVEGNLTALMHGSFMSSTSLTGVEVMFAVPMLVDWAHGVWSIIPKRLDWWDVTRFDASGTYFLGDDLHPFLSAASASWLALGSRNTPATVYKSSGVTAMLKARPGVKFKVYDKAAEAAGSRKMVVAGTVRAEVEVRPTKPMTLDVERMLAMAKALMKEMADSVRPEQEMTGLVAQFAAAVQVTGQKADPFLLAATYVVVRDGGPKALEMGGASASTVKRRRADLKQALAAMPKDGRLALLSYPEVLACNARSVAA